MIRTILCLEKSFFCFFCWIRRISNSVLSISIVFFVMVRIQYLFYCRFLTQYLSFILSNVKVFRPHSTVRFGVKTTANNIWRRCCWLYLCWFLRAPWHIEMMKKIRQHGQDNTLQFSVKQDKTAERSCTHVRNTSNFLLSLFSAFFFFISLA